jgi:predicted dehydrogenase
MKMHEQESSGCSRSEVSRREFLKTSAALSAAALVSGLGTSHIYAAGSDTIKIGLIGCGGRGTGATGDCLAAAKTANANVQVWACGDLWADRAKGAGNQFKVPEERCFGGFDNYEKVIGSGVDAIVTAAPPGFRPYHVPAAIAAGKHVFMEKPVCVDPWGYREMIKAHEMATQKKLTVVAGTQRRHSNRYRATLKEIRNGRIGKIVGGQFYWMGGPVTHNRPRGPNMSDIEWQVMNWYAWCWTCGDHIVEQHVHDLDIMLWALGSPPEKCVAVGGRQVRPEPGNIWDHFAVEYEFPGGVRCASYCSHWPKSASRVSERVVGEKGVSNCAGDISGETKWNFQGQEPNAYVQEHVDFLASIKGDGPHYNETQQVAESTMTAVMGRMAAYTGREISWKWATESSKLRLGPENWNAFGPFTPPPVPVPGKTELI